MTEPTRIFELIRHRDLTSRMRSFECRQAGGGDFDFAAGQYIVLEFTLEGAAYSRPYSIASPPRGDGSIEFLCGYRPESPGPRFLWGLEPGARIHACGPRGSLKLRGLPSRDAVFIANGTGISPVRSMLHASLRGGHAGELGLLFGVRDQTDLVYHEEFRALARRHANFSYDVVLSRPLPGWTGRSGRMQEHVAQVVGNRGDLDAYLSGSPDMVKDIRAILQAAGLDPDAICSEKYE